MTDTNLKMINVLDILNREYPQAIADYNAVMTIGRGSRTLQDPVTKCVAKCLEGLSRGVKINGFPTDIIPWSWLATDLLNYAGGRKLQSTPRLSDEARLLLQSDRAAHGVLAQMRECMRKMHPEKKQDDHAVQMEDDSHCRAALQAFVDDLDQALAAGNRTQEIPGRPRIRGGRNGA